MANNSSSSGLGLGSVIFLILLVLKLLKVITISWWWVFSPLIISLGLWVLGLIFLAIFINKNK